MLFTLIVLLLVCIIAIQDIDVRRDTFSTYFIGFVMIFDIITIAYQILKIIVR